jgi:glycosyltransferase involved in cell wall biosynthesis
MFLLSLFSDPLLAGAHKKSSSVRFFVFIPSYNNEQWCIKNLESVFCQTYHNWEIYYVNDCSQDRTGELVEKYIKMRGMAHKCHVVHNQTRLKAMANYYEAIRNIDPKKVVVSLDGDDFLAHKGVLQKLADVYKDHNVWMTYGTYRCDPPGLGCVCAPLPETVMRQRLFRCYPWVTSALRTFYAGLFQKIKKEHFMYRGDFVASACDLAMMFPMLEMASQGHIRYIKEVIYIYNRNNPISDDRADPFLQIKTDLWIRSMQPMYEPLNSLFSRSEGHHHGHKHHRKKKHEKKAHAKQLPSCIVAR